MKKPCLLALLAVVAAWLWGQTELVTMLEFDSPVEGPMIEGSFSSCISGRGDLNGDGYNDIVITGRPLGGDECNRILYVYLGGAHPDSVADYIIESPSGSPTHAGGFGSFVAYDGDLNGDGFNDLVVSAPEIGENGDPCVGKVYIYWGGASLSTTPDAVLNGLDYGDDCWGLYFGSAIDIAGDLNGDGYDDLVIGSMGPSYYWNGQVDILFGGNPFDTEADWHRQGGMEEQFGWSVATGDFSGDTISDLVVGYAGAPWIQSTFSIYLGDTIMNTEPDHTVYVNSYFESTRLNGDYNHDGYDDLFMIGGPGIISLMLGSSDFSDSLFAFPIEVNNINVRSFFYSRLCGEDYLTASVPIDSMYYIFEYDSQDTLSIAYTWHGGNYNPNARLEQGYFIGDYNGDGHGDILLSTRQDGGPWRFRILTTEYVSVEEHTKPVQAFDLSCYPNPTRGSSTIRFSLAQPAQAEVSIYNIRGQRVRSLTVADNMAGLAARAGVADAYFDESGWSVVWDGRDERGRVVPTGVYLMSVKADGRAVGAGKCMVVK